MINDISSVHPWHGRVGRVGHMSGSQLAHRSARGANQMHTSSNQTCIKHYLHIKAFVPICWGGAGNFFVYTLCTQYLLYNKNYKPSI